MPPEVQRLGRTLHTWRDKIANFHLARMSNGPTEALNNLIKRIAFGFRNFENHRIRPPALRRPAELASPGLDRPPMRHATPPDSDEPDSRHEGQQVEAAGGIEPPYGALQAPA